MKRTWTSVVDAPNSLLSYLLVKLPDTKRTTIKQWLRHRAVFVNGHPVTGHAHPLQIGDRIHLERGRPAASAGPKPDVVYEDRHLIVINKPAGLLTIATEKEHVRTAYRQVTAYVQIERPHGGERIFVVHRLDRETSGLLLFARSERVKRALQDNWDQVEKRYYAVTEGAVRENEGTIKSHLSEHPKSLKVHPAPPSDGSKLAVTNYRVIARAKHYTALDVAIQTGRKNQIRAHLSGLGHPIAGDRKYGAKTDPARRLCLHACYLAFRHPVSGKPMIFRSAPPVELKRLTGGKSPMPRVSA